jgi:hypothetical protein
MAHSHDLDAPGSVVDHVKDSVLSYSKAVLFPVAQFLRLSRPWRNFQAENGPRYSLVQGRRQGI